jgi:hypothetical protein
MKYALFSYRVSEKELVDFRIAIVEYGGDKLSCSRCNGAR